MALFESYERRIDKINGVLAQYGIGSVEECRDICKARGFDPYEIVKEIQPICFENACWAYTVGAAIALKSGVRTAAEGAKMKADVESRLVFLEQCVGKVESLSAGRVENYTNRLYEKLKVILQDRDIDDARVLTEAAIFGDKTAVDEETVRLRSHIAQYRDILQLDEPVGRKLDFLTQELNRETNTIGSKCQDLDITRIVVDMKAEIEKIREQIQNLE